MDRHRGYHRPVTTTETLTGLSSTFIALAFFAAGIFSHDIASAGEECAQRVFVEPHVRRYDAPRVINPRSGSVISANFFNAGAISDRQGKSVSVCVTSPNNNGERRAIIEMDVGMDNNFQIKAYPEIIVGSKFGNHWETSHRFYNRDPLPTEYHWPVVSDNGVNFANLEYLTAIRGLGLPAYTDNLPKIDIVLDIDEENVIGAERDVMLESWFYDVSKNAALLGPQVGNTLNNIVGSGHPGFPALNNTLLEMMVHIGALSPNDVSRAKNNPGERRLTVALSGEDADHDGIDDALDIDLLPDSVDTNLDGIADDRFADVQIGDFRYSIWYGTTHVAPLILFSRETTRDGSVDMDLSTEGLITLDWNAFLDFALSDVESMLQARGVDWATGDQNPFPAMRSASGAISAVEFGVELQTNAAATLPYVATVNTYQVSMDGVEYGLGIVEPDADTDDDGYDNLTEFHADTDPLDAADAPAAVELPPNQWRLFSVPLVAPSADATIDSLFGDDITGDYGHDWRVFIFDANLASYQLPSPTDILQPGTGIWIIQSTDETVWLDMPIGSQSINTVQSPACGAFSGCVELPMADPITGSEWNLVGNPFHMPAPVGSMQVRSDTGHCSAMSGCSIVDPAAPGEVSLLSPIFFGFDGERYQPEDGTGSLQAWQAYWLRVTAPDSLQTPTLLLRRH